MVTCLKVSVPTSVRIQSFALEFLRQAQRKDPYLAQFIQVTLLFLFFLQRCYPELGRYNLVIHDNSGGISLYPAQCVWDLY